VLERRPVRATLAIMEQGADELDERSRAVLDFERESWQLEITKERAIRERFGFSPARYHQLLHRVIDRPEALAYDPMLVRRLRRVREARRRARTASTLGLRV
jgi:DNA-binding PadR family transcriptional regulator